ncbi:MAG TPA: RNA polymerase sigma factor, partial [Micromonosporaceae bacterium]
MDDNELISRVAGGDDMALRELFSRHAPWIAARLRAAMPAADVEDVVQETFLAVWRGASGYRPTGSGGGWLWGIARRQAALVLRRRGTPALELPEVLPIDDPTEGVVWRIDVEHALGPASEPDREVWQLMYVEDR